MRSVERTPHIWAHGETIEEFARARSLLTELGQRHTRYRLLLTARDAHTLELLRAAFPDATVEPPPSAVDWQVRQAVSRLRPHALLLLEHPHDLGRAVFDRARWWRFPIVLVAPGRATLSRVKADTESSIPVPRADQLVPFHFATRFALTPPAKVKSPPAYRLPLLSAAKA